ncbi:MAG: hypothetical protein PF961_09860 [Planctomycetota bacterium]|nr:hypothetical protein [Planctomycetota bacterium]
MRILLIIMLCASCGAADDALQALDARLAQYAEGDWSTAPIAYGMIESITAGSTAETIGLPVGGRLFRVNEQAITMKDDVRRIKGERTLQWWHQGEIGEAVVTVETIGFRYHAEIDLALWARRDVGVDDQHLLRAALCWSTQPALALSELAQLDAAAQNNLAYDLLCALLATPRGEPGEAARGLAAVFPKLPAVMYRPLADQLIGAAVAAGDGPLLAEINELAERLNLTDRYVLRKLSSAHISWPLADQIHQYRKLTSAIDSSKSHARSGQRLLERGEFARGAAKDHYFDAILIAHPGEVLSDSGHRISFDVRLTSTGPRRPDPEHSDHHHHDWPSMLWIRLGENLESSDIMNVSLYERQTASALSYKAEIEHFDLPSRRMITPTLDDWHNVTITQLGRAFEVTVDGVLLCRFQRRLSPRGLRMHIHTQGTHSDIRNFTWHEVNTREPSEPAIPSAELSEVQVMPLVGPGE